MTKKISVLVAPNSFKECADSTEIAALMKTSFNRYVTDSFKKAIEFTYKPISDGGDGFFEVCKNQFGLETLHFEVSRAFDSGKFFCPVGYSAETKTVYIESAEVIGLKTIPIEKRKPLILSSKGMGDLLVQLLDGVYTGFMDIEKVVIGVGGTGTNDLGMGMMEVFGLEFYDTSDNKLSILPKDFHLVEKIAVPELTLPFKIELICDVENKLLGENGATKMFSKQKGATEEETIFLEEAFENVLKQLELDEDTINSLSGAGGGLAAAMKIFFNSDIRYAEQFIKEDFGVDSSKNVYDVVVTGEGKFDSQSMMNKGALIISNDYSNNNTQVYFICGISEGTFPENDNLHIIELSEYFDSVEDSIRNIDKGIDIACKKITKNIIQLIAKKEN